MKAHKFNKLGAEYSNYANIFMALKNKAQSAIIDAYNANLKYMSFYSNCFLYCSVGFLRSRLKN